MKAVDKIDWELLHKQKLQLVEMLMHNFSLTNEDRDALDGVVNLLDAMEDEKHFSDKAKKITDKF